MLLGALAVLTLAGGPNAEAATADPQNTHPITLTYPPIQLSEIASRDFMRKE